MQASSEDGDFGEQSDEGHLKNQNLDKNRSIDAMLLDSVVEKEENIKQYEFLQERQLIVGDVYLPVTGFAHLFVHIHLTFDE